MLAVIAAAIAVDSSSLLSSPGGDGQIAGERHRHTRRRPCRARRRLHNRERARQSRRWRRHRPAGLCAGADPHVPRDRRRRPRRAFPGLYVTPAEFAAQMHALKRAGWTAVTLDEVAAYWRGGVSLPAGKPIVLSFDNGYHSQFTQALPVLRRLGWVGDENIQLTGLPPSQGGLGQAEVRGLIAAGWELDTQGISHADLITLDSHELHEQVAGTRAILRRRYGVPVNWFCYPSGHYDATVVAARRSCTRPSRLPDWVRATQPMRSLARITTWGAWPQAWHRVRRPARVRARVLWP